MSPPPFRAFALACIFCAAASGAAHADDAAEIRRLFAAGEHAEAFERVDRLLAERPKDAQLRFQKAVMLADAGRRSEAAELFTQLSVDYPDMPEPYNNLAVIHAAEGDYDRARAALDAALRASPNYATAHQNLGDVHAQLARRSYLRAQELDPGNRTIAPKLALLREIVKPIGVAPAARAVP